MEDNPYKAPNQSEALRPIARLLIFAVGAALLWPACWALGRGLIPPDDVALRFSNTTYVAAVVVWGIYMASRNPPA
jgi:hypothetical protein